MKEEQNDDEESRVQFIKALRIKKDSYYIANSEVIGDVLDDNDEVFCDIAVPGGKKESKKEKMGRKNKERKREKEKIKKR